jgi:hypothetical protein
VEGDFMRFLLAYWVLVSLMVTFFSEKMFQNRAKVSCQNFSILGTQKHQCVWQEAKNQPDQNFVQIVH